MLPTQKCSCMRFRKKDCLDLSKFMLSGKEGLKGIVSLAEGGGKLDNLIVVFLGASIEGSTGGPKFVVKKGGVVI